MFDDNGDPVPAADGRGFIRFKLSPGYDKESGRHMSGYAIAQRHVLDFTPPLQRTSKHAAGRTKPLTKEQRRKRDKVIAQLTRLAKRAWMDKQAMDRALADG